MDRSQSYSEQTSAPQKLALVVQMEILVMRTKVVALSLKPTGVSSLCSWKGTSPRPWALHLCCSTINRETDLGMERLLGLEYGSICVSEF